MSSSVLSHLQMPFIASINSYNQIKNCYINKKIFFSSLLFFFLKTLVLTDNAKKQKMEKNPTLKKFILSKKILKIIFGLVMH